MNRILNKLILALFVVCTFFSCSEDILLKTEEIIVVTNPEVSVSEGTVNYFDEPMVFTSDGGIKILNFTTNGNWILRVSEIQNSSTWCTVSQSEGKAGTYNVVVTAAENSGSDDRNVVLELSVEGMMTVMSKYVYVNQKQKNTLTLSSDRFEIGAEGGIVNLNIASNVDYSVDIPEGCREWISQVSGTRSLDNKSLSFKVAKSDEYSKREGELIVKSHDMEEMVKIYQTGSAILVLSKNEYVLDSDGGTITIDISSNFQYDVVMPNVNWIKSASQTRAVSSHTLKYDISPNETYNDRSAEIIFKDANSDKEERVSIKQKQKEPIATSLKIDFTNTSGTIGGELYIGKNYGLSVTATPSNSKTDYEWKVEDTSIATISGSGSSVTLRTQNFGKSKVVVTEKYSGISKSYEFSTAVTNFQITENTGETGYGYPKITLVVGEKYQLHYSCSPSYATNVFSNLDAFNFKEYVPSIHAYGIVSKSSIVDIDKDGVMTALKVGNTIINANNSYGVYKSGSNDGIYVEVVSELTEKEYNDDFSHANTMKDGQKMKFRLSSSEDIDVFKFTRPSQYFYVKVTYDGDLAGSGEGTRILSYSVYNSNFQEFLGGGGFFFEPKGGEDSKVTWINTQQGYIRFYVKDVNKMYSTPNGYFTVEFVTYEE